MSETEAAFIQGRIEEHCHGTLLAHLAGRPKAGMADHFWEEPEAVGAEGAIPDTVEVARRFSLHVEGMRFVYNLMLAERHKCRFGDPEDWVGQYSDACREWAGREAAETDQFDTQTLWTLVEKTGGTRVRPPQRAFVEAWTNRLAAIGPEEASTDDQIRTLITDRERVLKGRHRARLVNANRLVDWGGESGVGRMDFNWFRAREMLAELHRGLR